MASQLGVAAQGDPDETKGAPDLHLGENLGGGWGRFRNQGSDHLGVNSSRETWRSHCSRSGPETCRSDTLRRGSEAPREGP